MQSDFYKKIQHDTDSFSLHIDSMTDEDISKIRAATGYQNEQVNSGPC